jgi:hypothetical protein
MAFETKILARCQLLSGNDGIVKALFSCHQSDALSPEYVLMNVNRDRGEPHNGREYWITFEPAYPHSKQERPMGGDPNDPNKPRPNQPGDQPNKPGEPQPTR